MKKAILISIISLIGLGLSAQESKKIIYGANASVDLGRFQDRIDIIPSMSIKVLPKTYIGLGANFTYYSVNNIMYEEKDQLILESNIKDQVWYWGASFLIRFIPFENKTSFLKNFFVQTSFEALFGNGLYKDKTGSYEYQTKNFTPFAGIGYKHPLSNRLSLSALVSFKLNNEADSPYRNPLVRIAIEF